MIEKRKKRNLSFFTTGAAFSSRMHRMQSTRFVIRDSAQLSSTPRSVERMQDIQKKDAALLAILISDSAG